MKLISLLLTFFLFCNLTIAQEIKTIPNTPNNTGAGQMIERYKNPASSKEGMDRQLDELDKLKAEKITELQAWENLISILEKKAVDFKTQATTLNIDDQWRNIEELYKNKNNELTINGIYEIINLFSLEEFDTFYDNNSNISLFKESLNEKINNEAQETLKKLPQVNLIYNIKNLMIRRGEIPSDNVIDQLLSLKNDLSTTKIQTLYNKASSIIEEEKINAIKQRDNINAELLKINEYYDIIVKAKEDKDISINHEAIRWGLPLFCITVIILFYGAFFYRKLSLKNESKNSEIQNKDHEQITKVLLEVITVLLLTMTVLILGLSGILKENVLGTLLGGIAGYILNKKQT